MGRRSGVVIVSAVVLVVALVVGVRLATQPRDDVPSAGAESTPSPSATSLPSSALTTRVDVPAYFVGESVPGRRLYLTAQRYDASSDSEQARLTAAVQGVVGSRSGDPERTSDFPDGTTATVRREDDQVTVDLAASDADSPVDLTTGDAADGELALQAVVWTVDEVLDEDVPVQFELDGAQVETILGVSAASPVVKGDELETLAPIQIEEPGSDAVTSPFTVSGRAAANEAAISWTLESEDGAVVDRGTATAQECCTLSPYSFEVSAPAGRYTLRVSDSDESGAGRVNDDSRPVTVR